MEVGLRVVRGPDWKWGNQDDGEGHVGTVVEIGKPGSSTSPDKTVVVQWDSGSRTNYRVGYQGAYDLRTLDNAPLGVKHPNIICDSCRKQGIAGMRWKCTRCYDFDLCTQCYMSDKHDLTHPFLRLETAASTGVEMPKRQGAVRLQMKGIFVSAKVVRGPDWDWGNQDGGEGKTGKVLDIRGWDNESERSVANVTWSSGSTNVYRLGHKGKVDLKYTQDAVGGYYYRDHLPILGQIVEDNSSKPTALNHPRFSVGDKVQVLLDIETLKIMQEGHGGWNPRMAEFVGKVGTVHRVTDKGDIRVQYEGCNNRWTFHPGALKKVQLFSVGDMVRIIEDMTKMKELQKGHGEWIEVMKVALGKTGKITKIYSDGDLRVNVDGQTWTFNPLCVTSVPGTATEMNNTMTANQREEHTHPLLGHLLVEPHQLEIASSDRLVREAAQGHTDVVRDLLQKFPDKVDQKSSGKTALQVASHQGHLEIVRLLLAAGSSLEVQDDDGDTALHYSAFGNQPVVMDLLLKKGSDIDTVNKARCSPLHVAVNKQHLDCVKVLLKHHCNVNIQDSYGDTALHDAISKENLEILDLLINIPEIDFTLKNKRGFNVLHHAALKGNNFATERLISKSRQIVDGKKDDGFAALHLAALNGHFHVAETLLMQGHCEIDVRNNRKQTPLLLAISLCHCSLVELLVSLGADVNVEDEDGDTGLHLAVSRQNNREDGYLADAPTISNILAHISGLNMDKNYGLAMACYLAQEGADLHHKNRKGKTPSELVHSSTALDLLQHYAALKMIKSKAQCLPVSGESSETPQSESKTPELECVICSEAPGVVTFDPCGHKVTCEECCLRMKKCIICQEIILKKTASGGRVLSSKCRQASVERLRYLESKIQEIEEAHSCSICMERRRNVAFMCGHGACVTCAHTLKTCHMCRKPITKKINLY
ncbi:E3 ubiquitin-protein ligase MIB2-like [Stegodyphus dumicola]|uniref:E3 ubiquitin-protein ligase MIB2-like n=1 Tax=Stegodyphus dumicola TaxID=202533 RepID=UPI0015AAF4D2|nr:E3 ubiquitin-protein ligase MIB2-like [Stegodyphus dumicola]XP_035211066.1 E3 ubiquitin-protein ligase MIB2-like [Stegodyphus dumicola]